jgi:hypothetical protein
MPVYGDLDFPDLSWFDYAINPKNSANWSMIRMVYGTIGYRNAPDSDQ